MRVKTITKRDHAIIFHLEEWEINEILKSKMVERIYNSPSLVKFMDKGWKIKDTIIDRNKDQDVIKIAFFFHNKSKEEEHDD